jgi:hypothetical protein
LLKSVAWAAASDGAIKTQSRLTSRRIGAS